jgi:hypothetical protein
MPTGQSLWLNDDQGSSPVELAGELGSRHLGCAGSTFWLDTLLLVEEQLFAAEKGSLRQGRRLGADQGGGTTSYGLRVSTARSDPRLAQGGVCRRSSCEANFLWLPKMLQPFWCFGVTLERGGSISLDPVVEHVVDQ